MSEYGGRWESERNEIERIRELINSRPLGPLESIRTLTQVDTEIDRLTRLRKLLAAAEDRMAAIPSKDG